MKIALFTAYPTSGNLELILAIVKYLGQKGHEVRIVNSLKPHLGKENPQLDYFNPAPFINPDYDFLFSVGGDGNLLRAVTIVGNTEIPILGINTGRLGFLTSMGKDDYHKGINLLLRGDFSSIRRSLLQVQTIPNTNEIEPFRFALNEVCVTRTDDVTMLQIETQLNNWKLTTYWGDGLIISSPTGSTGYSMSVGGPIISPDTECLVLNPIAPHNISVRPLVIPDSATMELNVSGRGTHHLLSLDASTYSVPFGRKIIVKKADFFVYTIELKGDFFFKALQKKLLWGQDNRNNKNGFIE